MLHDEPMDFLWLGVLLERVGQTARMLDMHHHIQGAARGPAAAGADRAVAVAAARLLRLRGVHAPQQGRVSREAAVSFLLFEARFPRSLRYCVRSALALARRLDATGGKGAVTEARGAAGGARPLARQAGTRRKSRCRCTALLTHVVDEASIACQELQQGVEGASAVAAAAQKAAAQ